MIRHRKEVNWGDSADPQVLGATEWNAAHLSPAFLIYAVHPMLLSEEPPAVGLAQVGGGKWAMRYDCTFIDEVRLVVNRLDTDGDSAEYVAKFSRDLGVTWDLLDRVDGCKVTLAAGNVGLPVASPWRGINQQAKADVLLAVFHGNATAAVLPGAISIYGR